MIHIFKHRGGALDGKFDVAVVNSRKTYLMGSNQGYERKSGAVKVIASMLRMVDAPSVCVQDDTEGGKQLMWIHHDGTCIPVTDKERSKNGLKPEAIYIPD